MPERNLRSVDLNLLVVFDALMVERSVTRAAEKNGLSQPAVSKALNRLRYLFEDPLFVRRDREMEPTDRAKVLAEPIHIALRDISRTLRHAEFDPGSARGQLQIASIDTYHTPLIAELIRHLRLHAPGVQLHVHALESVRVHEHLESGKVALAFSPLGTRDKRFHSLPLWKDHLVTLTSKRSGLTHLSAEAYAALPHVVDSGHVRIADDGSVTSVVDVLLGARGLKRNISLVLPSAAGLPFMVASTDMIATLPSKIAAALVNPCEVNVIPCPFKVEVAPHMIWHAQTQADPLLGWLRQSVSDIAAALQR